MWAASPVNALTPIWTPFGSSVATPPPLEKALLVMTALSAPGLR
jgi:hypothetical protein